LTGVRSSVKAIVIRDDALLVLRCRDDDGDRFILPGGGQEVGETVHEALHRECLEELGCSVTIGRMRFIRDYIARHHEFADVDGDAQQVELMFECALESEPDVATVADKAQVGHTWLGVADLSTHRLYPRSLAAHLGRRPRSEAVYLGDCD
jgi:8-oxo-dGTP diphosphatase